MLALANILHTKIVVLFMQPNSGQFGRIKINSLRAHQNVFDVFLLPKQTNRQTSQRDTISHSLRWRLKTLQAYVCGSHQSLPHLDLKPTPQHDVQRAEKGCPAGIGWFANHRSKKTISRKHSKHLAGHSGIFEPPPNLNKTQKMFSISTKRKTCMTSALHRWKDSAEKPRFEFSEDDYIHPHLLCHLWKWQKEQC